MKRTARTLAVVVATATLALTGQALQSTASAKPDHAGSHAKGGAGHGGGAAKAGAVKGDAAKVLRDIDRLSAALDRTVRANRIGTLAEDVQTKLHEGVDADKQALTDLAAAASAADSTLDLRQVRRDLRQLRPENYVLSVNVLRKAAELAEAAAADVEALALVDEAVATALTVNASSDKSLLREARASLAAAQALLDDEADATEDPATDPATEDPATDPTAPVTA
jgi:hypothetical protein